MLMLALYHICSFGLRAVQETRNFLGFPNSFHLQFPLFLETFAQGFWHAGGWGTWQTEEDLHWVVDEPLQSGQGPNHNDTGSKSLPHACKKSKE